MSTRRTAKVAKAIQHVVSNAILLELRDPRVKNVTVLHVEVPVDLRTAKIYISIMGDEKEQSLCLHGLNSARGWVQSRIADQLDLRYTPVITFVLDPGVKNSIEISRMLRDLETPPTEPLADDLPSGPSPDVEPPPTTPAPPAGEPDTRET